MRKLFWVLAGIMVLAALGNIIGGTDTPVTARVDPAGGQAVVRADIPAAPRFDATLFVSANSLNLREAPSTSGRVLTSLPRNTRVLAGERRSGWVLISAQGRIGWVSERYLTGAPVEPAISVPTRNQPGYGVVQRQTAASCPSRRYCSQIGSCREARRYLANCSWGGALDGDGDGVPCESICR
ncbi:SH3 domain-containing protein [Devosia sp. Root635]|uniref:SH3 domain-containing protein n=1 Tax=Devosia sp. Root635 TaxID=1736575 RepID=UPI0006F9B17C|nr:SH3 domain-containing protein [Devosia sp. Root635]KRA50173.1 hypothetical protein ASD80_16585 [Devosia sp. Root635]